MDHEPVRPGYAAFLPNGVAEKMRTVPLTVAMALVFSCGGPRAGLAQCRPYVFGIGHYLAKWAEQAWTYDAQAMDKMVEIGATAVWVDFPWSSMEPVQGTIDWSYADHQVATAEARGLQMFAFVGTTPDWAKLYPHLPNHRTPPSEEHVAAFQAFHTALAARYAGRVTYYQFWNEPSGCGWINENCANGNDCYLFTLWQKRAYDALKAGNPNCVVSTGGFDGDPAGYVNCMYTQLAGQRAFDAVSIHPYAPGGPGGPGTSGEGIDYSDLTTVHQVMADHGDADKFLWITEYGWSSNNETQKSDDLNEVLTELKKPDYSYVFFAKYLVLNDWNNHDGDPNNDFCCFGLTDEYLNPKPTFYTFKNFNKTFDDVVEFIADRTIGQPPLLVHFNDHSCVNGATAWFWEFGDGQTSTDQNPTHLYLYDGRFTVRLTVTGTAGPITLQKTNYISVGTVAEIINPSFEDAGNFLAGWSSCLGGESSIKHNPSTHIPSPRFHDGTNSAGMSSDRAGNSLGPGAIWQTIAVRPTHTYRVCLWATITASEGQYFDDFVELRLRDGDGSPLNCLNGGANITDNSVLGAHLDGQEAPAWVQLQADITPRQGLLTAIVFWRFAGTVRTIHSLHLDDWAIEDITQRPRADFDGDLDVDDADFDLFQGCATGAGVATSSLDCDPADFDGDRDVDQADFGLFQRCFSGPGMVPASNCAH
ncbi:MAG: PKD domain-containing protein [Phycisphaerae bacterium]